MTDEKQAAPHCDEISPNFVLRYPCMSRRYSVHLAGQLLVLVANAVAALLVYHQFWAVITRPDVNGTTLCSTTAYAIITLVPSL